MGYKNRACGRWKSGAFNRSTKRPIQLLISNGETLQSVDLQPAVQRNLQAWAKANKVTLSEMIKLALDFTTRAERRSMDLDLKCPDERSLL
jgi:macrodomain Ter protein organizer (MatP/YcbG family)